MSKPTLFIGSSRESLDVARALQAHLHSDVDVQLWDQGIFGLGDYTLDALLKAITKFDFAVFVFAADDTVKSRGKRFLVARDNVVLELGLFVSRLGRERTFVTLQRTKEVLQLPTDLHGLNIAHFDWEDDQPFNLNGLKPKLGHVSVEILSAIQKAGTDSQEVLNPLSGGMVFLALLLSERTYNIRDLAAPFRTFEESSVRSGEGEVVNYTEKATKYACQCLQALGIAQPLGGDEFTLTELGKELLRTGKLQARYANAFDVYRSMRKS